MSNDEYGYGAGAGYSTGQNANVSFGGSQDSNAAGPLSVKDISTAEFMPEVIEASKQRPVLVDFWAPWCGPCTQLAPTLEKAIAATNGKVALVKMDIDKHPEIPGQLGVQSIPAVFAFVDGKPVDAFMGVKSEGEIREFIAKVAGQTDISVQIDEMLEEAAKLVEQGAIAHAGDIYGQILSTDPENLKAIAGVGKLYLKEENLDGVRGVLSNLDEKQLEDVEIASLCSALELAEQAEKLGDTSQFEASLEKNPDDHQARIDLAIALNARNQREAAADELLTIIKKAPGWSDDAAKSQLLQFFEAWGMSDEATVAARRKLSSVLFS